MDGVGYAPAQGTTPGGHADGHINLNKRVVSIDLDRKIVRFADGAAESYDVLISAMPLDVLCRDILTSVHAAKRRSDSERSLREVAQTPEAAIRAELNRQVEAWNRGDIPDVPCRRGTRP